MTKENQKVMYEHFKKLSVEGKTDIQRKHCKGYAADILKSFPDFEKVPEEKKESAPEKETKSKGNK